MTSFGLVQGLRSLQTEVTGRFPRHALPVSLASSPPLLPCGFPMAYPRFLPHTAHGLGLLPASTGQPQPGQALCAGSQREQTDPCPVEWGAGRAGGLPRAAGTPPAQGRLGYRPAGSSVGSGDSASGSGNGKCKGPEVWVCIFSRCRWTAGDPEALALGSFPTVGKLNKR